MTAGTYNITVEQGATFERVITWKDPNSSPYDLTGYKARMQARINKNSSNSFIDLTTENGGISLGGSTGKITLFMANSLTCLITQTRGVYDLELESTTGFVTRLLEGNINISHEVTR